MARSRMLFAAGIPLMFIPITAASYDGIPPDKTDGQLNPALASRLKVDRTVDGATPTRRAISFNPSPAVLKRSTSRTWRIVVLSAGIRSPVQKQRRGL